MGTYSLKPPYPGLGTPIKNDWIRYCASALLFNSLWILLNLNDKKPIPNILVFHIFFMEYDNHDPDTQQICIKRYDIPFYVVGLLS